MPVPAKAVTVTYTDEAGKEIHQAKSISGNIGDSYDATTELYKLSIKGYTLDQTKLPKNGKGTLTADRQTVAYVYQANKPVPAKADSHHLKDNYSNGTHSIPKTGEQVSNKLSLIGGILIVLIAIAGYWYWKKTLSKELWSLKAACSPMVLVFTNEYICIVTKFSIEPLSSATFISKCILRTNCLPLIVQCKLIIFILLSNVCCSTTKKPST